MPLYSYQCRKCNHSGDEFYKMASVPALALCPKCHELAFAKVVTCGNTDMREFHKPIEMMSVAAEDLDEIRRLQRECPDADICDDESSDLYGIPVARTRKAKLQVLKATGFKENN